MTDEFCDSNGKCITASDELQKAYDFGVAERVHNKQLDFASDYPEEIGRLSRDVLAKFGKLPKAEKDDLYEEIEEAMHDKYIAGLRELENKRHELDYEIESHQITMQGATPAEKAYHKKKIKELRTKK